jgi:hypothetical protein
MASGWIAASVVTPDQATARRLVICSGKFNVDGRDLGGIWHLIDAPENPRNITLAALVLMEQKSAVLPQLFSAEIAHAPAPLDEREAALVAMLETRDFTDPAMPRAYCA